MIKVKSKKIISSINWKTNKLKDFEKILYETAIKFYLKKLIGNANITINIRFKKTKKSFGFIELTNDSINKHIFNLTLYPEMGYKFAFIAIAHELIHIKQIYKKELSRDGDIVLWHDKPLMSLDDLNKANEGRESHDELPFEKEANNKSEILHNQFFKSEEFKNLKNINPILKYIVENIL